ncbi:short chain dehydrogenase [Mycobacterium sp. MS1601]|uniref:SDR family oxidoreductase n=1 Tax=Mycobacterium sp. MS1601 TaxID=1936029 RepID=UPI0009798143|nr:SDR family oxidoreductase [Mycobacterium sp. MS1601]AQA04817.1 short chain dehydrogenase [Mycobacterium sp. MS1601]
MEPRFINSVDDVRIATYEQGNPDGPTLVLTHGWPDSHVLWDGVVPLLADKFRIIRFDNRGVGASTVPAPVDAYRMERFADDLEAVITTLAPGEPVHVLGHDWGSVATWEYLGRPGAGDRVASFTSVSGPSTDHYKAAIWRDLARPHRPLRFLKAAERLLRLTYMFPLATPVLTPLVMRALFSGRRGTVLLTDGAKRFRSDTTATDLVNSLKIYRAMVRQSPRRYRSDHYVSVPVQLIVNTKDPVVRPHGLDAVSQWAPRLWRRDIMAGHWAPMTHPQVLARAVTELVEHLDGAPAARELLRAQVGRPRKPFGDTLVSVTGAGSGIGRATAVAFAAQGAEVVVSDINEDMVKETAAQIAAAGGVVHPYVLDVSDAGAMERFADQVCTAHGVPDVVVNNAGIGQAGDFLDTPAEQFDRVLDVNLGGVVNGCRAFAGRLVARGTGGHIVNVASMAAYAPSQGLNAYCTSKAAVYMFSDCLRAELSSAGIGLTTICPGVVDTDIVRTTRFDVPADKVVAAEAARGRAQKAFGARHYGPEKVAAAIIASVHKNTAVRPVTPEAHLVYGVARVAPQILRSTARGKLV